MALSLNELQAAGDDDCEFDFYAPSREQWVIENGQAVKGSNDWRDFLDVMIPGVAAAWADIRIKTRDGDVESTSEDIWAGHHNINNEDIDGDYNLDRIEIDLRFSAVAFSYRIGVIEYISINCGPDINPSGFIKITDRDTLTKDKLVIYPAAFSCGGDQECLAQHITAQND
eukprot:CAMPEP_0201595698 /NCGR_PEP_ID=MMETSP0190_2-20130828/192614_1 /ASSEMBLY_ACC=CAM_ASM_000263 /TAXON_ID=37353 /ORGANISM="Rosalina sp." /LENGTH=170 /DNA_ID=CAMNT_0048055775 /DNA_START=541 /DNA_END=1053 /DNA_ORIENTATION=-